MSRTPCCKQLLRNRQVADLRHARSTDRPTVLQHQHTVGRCRQVRVVDACAQVVHVAEDNCPAAMLEQRRGGGTVLDDGAVGCKVAAQDRQSALGLQGIVEGADHIGILNFGILDDFRPECGRSR